MLTKFKTLALAAGVSGLALASAATASDDIRISAINVESSATTATGSNALEVYPTLVEDLRAEVADRVPLSSDGADPEIRIDIRKIALNGAIMLGDDKKFNQLEGVVDVSNPTGQNAGLSFPVMISAQSGDEIIPMGTVTVPPSETDFYSAMISSFADVVAEGLSKVNTAGDGIDP